MNRQKLTAAAVSLMLTASMSVPAMPAPATVFAQDFEETSTEPQDPAVSSDQPIDDEDAEIAAYMQENGIDPQSDITGDEDIVIDLNNSLSSDMTATVYPWASETAVMDETGKTGSVTVDLKLDELLENVPTIFDKQIGWWKNARLWPLQSKVGDTVENGLPIDLTLKVPAGVTLNDAPVITDNTSGVDYSWSDNSSRNLFSEQTVTVTDPQTAQIHLRIGYTQYGKLLDAIENKTIGSWSVKIPTTYSITKGEKYSDETMTLSGTTGYPYHKTGFGAALNMVTTVPDASAPVFSAQPIEPTGTVDENINIQSGLQINSKDEKDVKLSKGETFTLAGTLDTKPIQDVIKDKIGKYGVGDVLDKVDVNNLSLTMTSAIRLPEAVAWNQDASTVSFDGDVKDFKIVDAKLTSGTLLVTFNLTDTSSVHTLKDLVTIMENTPDSLKINIGGLSTVNSTGDAPQQIQATVTGTFNADALLPAEATTPGYYDIEYTFVDTARPTINVSVSDEVKMAALYRLYNPNTGEHFYTQSQHERDALVGYGWNDEGIGWKSPETSDYPVYRLYNPNAGDHHFTMDEHEKDVLVSVGWKYEGIAFYSLPENEGLRVYRAYNPNAKTAGAHNYTLNKTENDYLLHIGWIDEGTAWWAYDNK